MFSECFFDFLYISLVLLLEFNDMFYQCTIKLATLVGDIPQPIYCTLNSNYALEIVH